MNIVCIYYSASRDHCLTSSERMNIRFVLNQHSVKDRMTAPTNAGEGQLWQEFYLYDPPLSSPLLILEGATELPGSSGEETWAAVQHWCEALTAIRRLIPNAQWSVSVNDQIIHWYEESQSYDPSR